MFIEKKVMNNMTEFIKFLENKYEIYFSFSKEKRQAAYINRLESVIDNAHSLIVKKKYDEAEEELDMLCDVDIDIDIEFMKNME